MPQFIANNVHTAKVVMTNPTNKPFSYKSILYMGINQSIMTEVLFNLNAGESKEVSFSVTMPSAAGIYPVYIGVFSDGVLIPPLYRSTEDIVILLPTEITLSGVVTSSKGFPLQGVKVLSCVGYYSRWSIYGPETITNANGEYSLKFVRGDWAGSMGPVGQIYLAFTMDGYFTAISTPSGLPHIVYEFGRSYQVNISLEPKAKIDILGATPGPLEYRNGLPYRSWVEVSYEVKYAATSPRILINRSDLVTLGEVYGSGSIGKHTVRVSTGGGTWSTGSYVWISYFDGRVEGSESFSIPG